MSPNQPSRWEELDPKKWFDSQENRRNFAKILENPALRPAIYAALTAYGLSEHNISPERCRGAHAVMSVFINLLEVDTPTIRKRYDYTDTDTDTDADAAV